MAPDLVVRPLDPYCARPECRRPLDQVDEIVTIALDSSTELCTYRFCSPCWDLSLKETSERWADPTTWGDAHGG